MTRAFFKRQGQQMEDIQLALQKKLDVLEADRNRAQLRIQTLQKDCSPAAERFAACWLDVIRNTRVEIMSLMPDAYNLQGSRMYFLRTAVLHMYKRPTQTLKIK